MADPIMNTPAAIAAMQGRIVLPLPLTQETPSEAEARAAREIAAWQRDRDERMAAQTPVKRAIPPGAPGSPEMAGMIVEDEEKERMGRVLQRLQLELDTARMELSTARNELATAKNQIAQLEGQLTKVTAAAMADSGGSAPGLPLARPMPPEMGGPVVTGTQAPHTDIKALQGATSAAWPADDDKVDTGKAPDTKAPDEAPVEKTKGDDKKKK